MPITPHWEHFAHPADVGLRGVGLTKAEAFEQAARALTAVVCDPDRVEPSEAISIAVSAPDDALLLVDWLNALIFEMATRHMLFGRFRIRVEPGRLEGQALGEPVDRERHAPAVEPKAATYSALEVRPRGEAEGGGWIAQCVVDV